MYENLEKDKIQKILDNITDVSNVTTDMTELNEYEERLKDIKKVLMSDLTARENFILSLANVISTEKEDYFSYQDQLNA